MEQQLSNLFSRLLLYRPTNKVSPRENFVTELLCEVTRRDPIMKDQYLHFLWEILGMPQQEDFTGWTITTQYVLGSSRRPDIAILDSENSPKIFIEHKIDSPPDLDQLKHYSKFENDGHKYEERHAVILLTKYRGISRSEEQELQKHCPFRILWWRDLGSFLIERIGTVSKPESLVSNTILGEFVKFLEEEKMVERTSFDIENLIAFKGIYEGLRIIGLALDHEDVRSRFLAYVDSDRYKDSSIRSTQLQRFNRFVTYEQLLDFDSSTLLLIGVNFGEYAHGKSITPNENGYASAIVTVQTDPRKPANATLDQKISNLLSKHPDLWKRVDKGQWDVAVAALQLNLLQSQNHVYELATWYCSILDTLSDAGFRRKNPSR